MDMTMNEPHGKITYHQLVSLFETNLLNLCYCIAFFDLTQALVLLVQSWLLVGTDVCIFFLLLIFIICNCGISFYRVILIRL